MKFSISGRHPLSLLKKTDEIKMRYEDRDKILDYIEQIPEKTIVLEIPSNAIDLNWSLFKMYAEKINFILAIQDLTLAANCKENNIQFYWNYPITSFYELNGLINLQPCYLWLGAPLSFNLPTVKRLTQIPIRLNANVCYLDYIPRSEGIRGSWIRPEGIPAYEPYVDLLEFKTELLQQEEVLFHVYHDNGTWPGNLNLLLHNLNINVDNRAIDTQVDEARTKCGQRCMENGACHLCYSAIKFADALRKKHDEITYSENS